MKKKNIVLILALVFAFTLFPSLDANAADGPVITQQPEDVIVSYPDGATFTVKVENPDKVESYQWMLVDIEGNEFFLEGSSAKTDTLIIPSTVRENNTLDFYCIITDKDGNETVSDSATLDMDNRDVIKPVFYVGEYAIEPGEFIDLSKVDIGDGYKLGSGTVSYDRNATDITISNLDFDNSHTMCGLAIASNVGLSMEFYEPDQEEYNVTFVGDNRIMNTYYDYDYNLGGIPLDFYFDGDGPKPLVNFIGDGTLTITNGTNAIRVIGDLMVGIDVTLHQTFDLYAYGICAHNLMVAEGCKLDLDVYGAALNAQKGNLYVEGADITVSAHAPHISMGTAIANIFQAANDIMLIDATINISTDVDPEICRSVAGYSGFSANGDFSAYNCDISYKAAAKENDHIYATDFCGITANSETIEDSRIDIVIDSPYIYGAGGVFGIYAFEDLSLLRSDVSVDIRSCGSSYGIAPEEDFSAEDSLVSVNVVPYADFGDPDAYGIMCGNAIIKLTAPKWQISSYAKDGIALGCNLGLDRQEEPAEFTEGYEAKNVYLRDDTLCLTPKNNVINLGNAVLHDISRDYYLYVETYYDAKDTAKPSEEVVFGIEGPAFIDVAADAYYADAVAWAVNNGMTEGTSATTFSPDDLCTRGQILTFLWRTAGKPQSESAQNQFTDVAASAYYYDAVLWAVEQDITKGTSETTFSPDDTCTRAEIMTFLWRAAGKPQPESAQNPFTDVADDAYYHDAVLWAVENDITKGTSETTFSPDDSCTRAQSVTLLYRYYNNAE